MIRHCVWIKFRTEVPEADRQALYRAVEGLKAQLPGFLAGAYGSNVSPETGMDKGFSEGFILDFADGAARDAYLVHPDHVAIGTRIVTAAVGGAAGVLVFDIETGD